VAIKILLAFSVAKGFKLYQIDVKSAFLNGVLEEKVYVRQPPGFESEKYPHREGFMFEGGLWCLKFPLISSLIFLSKG
jgi:hypothetical protein